jgi:hypothetical protein
MTIKNWFVALITSLSFLLAGISVQAQTNATSEEEVKKNAAAFFDKGDYPAAFPLYSQLLATYPKDPNYNYRFGVCMLYANADKDKALPFLEKASKDPDAEKEVWFYLGKAYHLNYRFDEAIVAYSTFKKLAGTKKAEKLQVDNQIAMCKTGRKLLRAITDIEVLDKKELSRNDFFRSYDLTGYSGQLLVKPDEFKTSLDKKKNETSVIFLSGEKNEIYFSSYGEDEENGKDIYIVRRLPNGSLSKPTNIGYPVNTEYDEDYPFLHPNGKVLYFCSKGHNSMGGYDIFRSELNEETNTWQKPVNLDFAINSPDDDILFITDMDEKSAYFASSRNSPEGQMTVYHVSIERKPVDMCLVKGNVRQVEGASSRSARILVKNEETGEPIGIYKSNETTGDYFINLPNVGGKFSFTVEKSGQETQTENVLFPTQYEMKPVRQEIGYREENGKPKLFVMTYFDDDTSMFSPEFLKQRAKLDVNYNGPEVTVIKEGNNPVAGGNNPKNGGQNGNTGNQTTDPDEDDTTDVTANVPSSQTKNITNEELVKIAYDDAKETKEEATDMRAEADRAMAYAVDLNEQTKEQITKAEQAKSSADAMPDGPEKTQAQEQALEEQAKANALQSQTIAAFGVAEALDRDADRKENESKLTDKYASSLDKAVKSKDPKALDALASQEQELENIASGKPEGAETAKNLRENADAKRTDLEKATASANQLREENKQIQEKVQRLKQEAAAEKDPDLKAGLANQVEGLEEELVDNNQDLKKADAKVQRLQNEVNALDNQAEAATNVLAQAKNTALPPKKVEADVLASVKQDVAGYERQVIENGGVPVAATSAPKNNGGNNSTTNGGNDPVAGGNNSTTNGGNNSTTNGGNDPVAGGNNSTTNGGNNSTTNGGNDPVAGGNNSTTNGGNNSTTNGGNDPVAGGNNSTTNGGNNSTTNRGNDPVAGGNNSTTNGGNNSTTNGGNDPVAGGNNSTTNGGNNSTTNRGNDPVAGGNNSTTNGGNNSTTNGGNDPVAGGNNSTTNGGNNSTTNGGNDPVAGGNNSTTNGGTNAATFPEASAVIANLNAQYENQLASNAGNETATGERQRAETLRNMANALDAEIEKREDALSNTTNQQEREQLKNAIAALENEKKTKLEDAQQADQRAEQLDIAAQSNTQPTTDPNARFATALENADTISNVADRERSKAQTYSEWADALTQQIAEKKTAMAATTDKAEKKQLKDEIKELEKQVAAKKQQAKASEAIAVNQPSTQLSSASSQTIAEVGAPFEERLKQNTDQAALFAAQETEKAQIYSDWADALEEAATAKDAEAAKIKNKKDRLAAQQTAADLRTAAAEKRTAAESATRLAANAATTNGNNTTANTNSTANTISETQVNLVAPGTQTALERKQQLLDEATAARQRQDSLNTLAANAQGAEKTKLLNDATNEQRIAWDKESQASAQQGAANEVQFNDNRQVLNRAAAGVDENDPTAQKAAALNDEATKLFELARQQRATANAANDQFTKKENLRKAEENEQQALLKQQQAMNAYNTITPGIASVNPTAGGGNPVNGGNDGGTNGQPSNGTNAATNGGNDPVAGGNNTTTNGGTNSTTNGGNNPVAGGNNTTTNAGTNSTATKDPINPTTGQPYTSTEIAAIRETEAYQNFSDLNDEAIAAEEETTSLNRQAAKYEASADFHTAEEKRLNTAAANTSDPAQRQQYLNEAQEEKRLAQIDLAKRDSMADLASNSASESRAKRNEADLFLQDLDKATYEQVKTVAAIDNPNARTTDPVAGGNNTTTNGGNNSTTNGGNDPVAGGNNTTTNGGNNSTTNGGNDPVAGGNNTTTNGGNNSTTNGGNDPVAGGNNTTTNGGNNSTTNGGNDPVAGGNNTTNNGGNNSTTNGGNDPIAGGNNTTTNGGNNSTTNGGNDPVAGGNNTTNSNNNNSGSVANRLAPDERFVTGNAANTSANQPIPINSDLPEGLVFKVQVGAFRNPISPSVFKGISPITGETTPQGLTRYMAGIFKQFPNADAAKNEIRRLGYPDAFVVAFYNGKRISMAEAMRLSGQNTTTNIAANNGSNAGGNNDPTNTNGGTNAGGNTTTTNGGNNNPIGSNPPANAAPATNVAQVQGLFYTVQVGVFSRPVSRAQLYNLNNLYSENTPNGYIRYSSGSYNSLNGAVQSKNEIVTTGVKDAFVVAYYNGKRITLAEARLLEAGGVVPSTTNAPANTTNATNTNPTNPTTQNPPSTNGGNVSLESVGTAVAQPVSDTGLVFLVQLGAFRENIPQRTANNFLQFAGRGVQHYVDPKTGFTVYTVGQYNNYEQADVLRDEAIAKGITDAFITAWYGGKRITIAEAMKLSGK